MAQPPVEASLMEASLQTSTLEGVAEKLEDRLMVLETAAGKKSQAEVTDVIDATPAFPADVDVLKRVPVLKQKGEALESLVAKLAARIGTLELNSPRSISSAGSMKQIQSGESLDGMWKKASISRLNTSNTMENHGQAPAEEQLRQASRQICGLEGLAEKLEGRLMVLETASGQSPQAEVSRILGATPALPANANIKTRVPVLAKKSIALQSLIQKFAARVEFLESNSPRSPSSASNAPQNAIRPVQFEEASPQASRRFSTQVNLGKYKAQQAEEQIREANQQMGNLEHLAQSLEARLMVLETEAGRTPEAVVARIINDTPHLPCYADTGVIVPLEMKIPVLTHKSEALESLVEKLAARISLLEANSPRAPLFANNTPEKTTRQSVRKIKFEDDEAAAIVKISQVQPFNITQASIGQTEAEVKVLKASDHASDLEGLAEKIECRLMLLETASGKHPQAEVSQVIGATPEFPSTADVEGRVPVLVQKSAALESLAQKLLARISVLEVESPRLRPAADKIPDISVKHTQVKENPSEACRQISNVVSSEETAEAGLSIQKNGNIPKVSAMNIDELIRKEPQQSEIILSQHMEDHAKEVLQLHEELKQERSSKDEAVQALRMQADIVLKQHKEAQAKDVLKLREELQQERKSKDDIVQGLELQLKQANERITLNEQIIKELEAKLAEADAERRIQSGERAIFYEQTIKELEAKLVASAAERQRQSSERASWHEQTMKDLEVKLFSVAAERQRQSQERTMVYEQTIKELEEKLAAAVTANERQCSEHAILRNESIRKLEAKLCSAAAERQRQSSERTIFLEQTVKELEAKLSAAATERQQLVVSGESSQMEAVTHKQIVLSHEKKVGELTNDNNHLRQVLKEHQDKLQVQSKECDVEKKKLQEQVEELKRKIVVLEKTQRSLAANLSLGALASSPSSVVKPVC